MCRSRLPVLPSFGTAKEVKQPGRTQWKRPSRSLKKFSAMEGGRGIVKELKSNAASLAVTVSQSETAETNFSNPNRSDGKK